MNKILDFFGDRFLPFVEEAYSLIKNNDLTQSKKQTLVTEKQVNKANSEPKDTLILSSKKANSNANISDQEEVSSMQLPQFNSTSQLKGQKDTSEKPEATRTNELTKSEEKIVENLEKIDREVRNHEASHRSAGGGLVRGGTTFSYTVGPDGQQYAVAGEVKIDMSYDMDNPEDAIRKMQTVKRAALAPADPSSQDRAVASKAATIESQARTELTKKRTNKMSQDSFGINLLEQKYQNSSLEKDSKTGTLYDSTDINRLKNNKNEQ